MAAFSTLLTHDQSLSQLVSVLEPTVSKQKIANKAERELRIQILCEALWVLNNLTSEN